MPAGRALPDILAMASIEVPALPRRVPEPAAAGTVALRNVYLHVTKACNLRCAYCYFTASRLLPGEMSAADLSPLWPQLVTLRPGKVVFTGGEPLLRPDLPGLLRSLRAADPGHRVLRCLNTNGYLVTPQLARDLVGLADEVRVSVDALAARNDALRGAGSFAAALNALECLHDVGFEPKALVTVTATTLPDLEELLCLLADHKIMRININAFRPIGRGRRHDAWMMAAQEVSGAVHRAWQRSFPDRPVPADRPEPESCSNCGVGSFLNIMPNGDVSPVTC